MKNQVNLEMPLNSSHSYANCLTHSLPVLGEKEIKLIMSSKRPSLDHQLRNIFESIREFKPFVLNQIFPKQVQKYVRKKSQKLNKLINSLKNPTVRQFETAGKTIEITNIGQEICFNKLISNFQQIRNELLEEELNIAANFKQRKLNIIEYDFNVLNYFKLNGINKKKIKEPSVMNDLKPNIILQTSFNCNKRENEEPTLCTLKGDSYHHSGCSSVSGFNEDLKHGEDYLKLEWNNNKYSDSEEKENEYKILESIGNQEFMPNSFSDMFRY